MKYDLKTGSCNDNDSVGSNLRKLVPIGYSFIMCIRLIYSTVKHQTVKEYYQHAIGVLVMVSLILVKKYGA